jgi:hypothetical protein
MLCPYYRTGSNKGSPIARLECNGGGMPKVFIGLD